MSLIIPSVTYLSLQGNSFLPYIFWEIIGNLSIGGFQTKKVLSFLQLNETLSYFLQNLLKFKNYF
jgi:hypothetical protein